MAGRRGKSQHVTLVDVARESGFSPSTVSIVLNEAPLSRYVAATTKERIRRTAERLGYRPDAFARSLRSRRSHTVGVMIFDISDPFCTLILRGIERTLHPTPYLPIIMDAHNDRKQFEGYLEMLMDRRVEGLIVVANWLFEEGGLLGKVRASELPLIVVGRDLSGEGIRSVIVENERGGHMAMEHLYELGHRKIAVLRGPSKLTDSERRWAGIQRFAAERGLEIDARRVRQLPEALDPNSGFASGAALTEELLRTRRKFTGLVAFDDLTALGAVRALDARGLRVPEDCAVIGFDDVPPAWFSTPGISTIRQPMEEMGTLATELVLAGIGGADGGAEPDASEGAAGRMRMMLAPTLVVRGSTRIADRKITDR